MKKFTNREIADYYDQTVTHYRTFWALDQSLAIHYGIWQPGIGNFRQSLENTNRILAETAGIKQSDYILDAGCGVGGSAIYLAKQYGCHVKGITLSEKQVRLARENAEKNNLSALVSFENKDYCATGYSEGSFDLLWALESVGTAVKKGAFIKESYRILIILKPATLIPIIAGSLKTGLITGLLLIWIVWKILSTEWLKRDLIKLPLRIILQTLYPRPDVCSLFHSRGTLQQSCITCFIMQRLFLKPTTKHH